jgi:hypothetical protein
VTRRPENETPKRANASFDFGSANQLNGHHVRESTKVRAAMHVGPETKNTAAFTGGPRRVPADHRRPSGRIIPIISPQHRGTGLIYLPRFHCFGRVERPETVKNADGGGFHAEPKRTAGKWQATDPRRERERLVRDQQEKLMRFPFGGRR